MKHIRTSLNYDHTAIKGEKNTMPSMAIPDQSLSIQEILERYAKGAPLSGMRMPIYDDDEDPMPDPRTMDLADRQAYAEAAREQIRLINDQQQDALRSKQSALLPEADKKESQDPPPPPIS